MNFKMAASLVLAGLPLALSCTAINAQAGNNFTFSCKANNDLYSALASGERSYPRFADPHKAIAQAPSHSTVFILADEWPEKTTDLQTADLALAQQKDLRLFVECPPVTALPELKWGKTEKAVWERGVIAVDSFGASLPKMKILSLNLCEFQKVTASKPWFVLARVAGFESAVYGLPTNASPILFELPEKNVVIATTKLSGFNTARFAPAKDWKTFWENLLSQLDSQHDTHRLKFVPSVSPAYSKEEKLPRNFEKKAFDATAKWVVGSHLLVHPAWRADSEGKLSQSVETMEPPKLYEPIGDGSYGILEGYASGIRSDGNQFRRTPLRADCNTTSAMLLALDADLNRNSSSAKISRNLLDYVYFTSGMCGGLRGDPKNGNYGLIGWGAVSPTWLVANYGDDNANAILALMTAGVCLKNDKWDEVLMRAELANFRTTGKLGFRGDRIDLAALDQKGWVSFYNAETVNYSPHFESMLWACHLWAYQQTHYQPFLDRTRNAIDTMMKGYPSKWRWQDTVERSHMLLCLAWLVRVDDTPEHRQWLKTIARDLLVTQQATGAIHERLGGTGGGHYQIPQSNEAYGTGETPLIQKNGDPASDQLYTTGYALLGLHEAVGATGDQELKQAEDKLAEFLCRIQIRSKQFPYLNGFWFRAFDDRDWEFWASSADAGWGAWSLEAGWAQSWTTATLAFREKKTTMWELAAKSGAAKHFEKLKAEMLAEN